MKFKFKFIASITSIIVSIFCNTGCEDSGGSDNINVEDNTVVSGNTNSTSTATSTKEPTNNTTSSSTTSAIKQPININNWDFGTNNKNLVACVGDSLTAGYACDGAPYPSLLAGMISKKVINYGVGGKLSNEGVSMVKSALAAKPGYVCILFGSNDAIHKIDAPTCGENIRKMIQDCKKNKSIPIVANLPIMIGDHKGYNASAGRVSKSIAIVAKEEGAIFVDLRTAFGDGIGLINDDGLHLTVEGCTKLAQCFASKF